MDLQYNYKSFSFWCQYTQDTTKYVKWLSRALSEQPISYKIMTKRGNGPTCATSSRSRERENKNENRDNYLHEYNILYLRNNCCKSMNKLLTIAILQQFYDSNALKSPHSQLFSAHKCLLTTIPYADRIYIYYIDEERYIC